MFRCVKNTGDRMAMKIQIASSPKSLPKLRRRYIITPARNLFRIMPFVLLLSIVTLRYIDKACRIILS
jgi:hypothetical protein